MHGTSFAYVLTEFLNTSIGAWSGEMLCLISFCTFFLDILAGPCGDGCLIVSGFRGHFYATSD